MTYTIDIYRRQLEPTKSFTDFATYVAFFPQLVAGPIVRATQFMFQLEKPRVFKTENLESGLFRFLTGYFKKAFVGDILATKLVDPVFSNPSNYSTGTVWLALIGFMVQIYADFSGYSNMAIGSARILGFTLPENFNLPYISRNISEIWRRWHMTMSYWFRDYVYIGLGGNRKGEARTIWNLAVTVFLSGLWHGAAWTFVVHGLLYGVYLAVHQYWRKFKDKYGLRSDRPRFYQIIPAWLLTMFCFSLGLVLFRAANIQIATTYFLSMFGSAGEATLMLSPLVWFALASVVIDHAGSAFGLRHPEFVSRIPVKARALAYASVIVFLFHAKPDHVNPFIYFQF